jgi:peptide alpha-N-acetyltransferase
MASKRSVLSILLPLLPPTPLVQIILETEFDNCAALSLYESLGFIREKRLYRFYLNGKDAFRLVLAVSPSDSGDNSDNSSNASPTRSSYPRRPPYRAIKVIPYSDEEDDDYISTR